jgi:hypothetical protein
MTFELHTTVVNEEGTEHFWRTGQNVQTIANLSALSEWTLAEMSYRKKIFKNLKLEYISRESENYFNLSEIN